MFNISNKSLAYLVINTSCTITNAYLAPKTFTLTFAIGTAVGLTMGLKRRVDVLLIDYNQKAANAASEKAAQMAEKANQMTENLQAQASEGFKKVGATAAGQTAVHYANTVVETAKPLFDKVSFLAKPLLKLYLKFSGYETVVNTTLNYTTGFDEQRMKVIKNLNPIPRMKGTILSVAAVAANLGYLTFPVLSKLWILSGFTAGYATGLYVMQNSNWSWLQSEPYQEARKTIVSG